MIFPLELDMTTHCLAGSCCLSCQLPAPVTVCTKLCTNFSRLRSDAFHYGVLSVESELAGWEHYQLTGGIFQIL